MKTTSALICATLLSVSAFADSSSIIKQRAKELSNQNNVQQGVPPPSQPQSSPGTKQPAVATPLQVSIAHLRADLAAIKSDPAPTAAQKQQLTQHLIDTAQATKPSQPTASKLADDLSTALAQYPMSATDRDRLLSDINAALNPAKLQPDQLANIYADAQAIFQVAGLKRTAAVKISDDIKAVAAETKR
jgi:hypothetical protein